MTPDEARAHIGDTVIWQPDDTPVPVRILHMVPHPDGGLPRAWVRLAQWQSETDVDPEQLTPIEDPS